jgi:hypothetical protein
MDLKSDSTWGLHLARLQRSYVRGVKTLPEATANMEVVTLN